jgi:hypothetical protein
MPEKGDPMYWDDAIGRVRFRSVKIIIDCPSNWMNWRIFLVIYRRFLFAASR